MIMIAFNISFGFVIKNQNQQVLSKGHRLSNLYALKKGKFGGFTTNSLEDAQFGMQDGNQIEEFKSQIPSRN